MLDPQSSEAPPEMTTEEATKAFVHEVTAYMRPAPHGPVYGRFHCGEYDSFECICGKADFPVQMSLLTHLCDNGVHEECYAEDCEVAARADAENSTGE